MQAEVQSQKAAAEEQRSGLWAELQSQQAAAEEHAAQLQVELQAHKVAAEEQHSQLQAGKAVAEEQAAAASAALTRLEKQIGCLKVCHHAQSLLYVVSRLVSRSCRPCCAVQVGAACVSLRCHVLLRLQSLQSQRLTT